jgi:anti-anti-sigma regulatory factor
MDECEANDLSLPSRLDAAAVPDLLERLSSARGADLALDGSQVERIGGPALQLLASAFRTWREDGFHLRLSAPSPYLIIALDKLGFAKSTGALELQ